jgi:hypothetical protein
MMTGYTLQIFKIVNDSRELVKEIQYPNASGHAMMDVVYGARHYGIAEYFNLPVEHIYDLDF